MSFYCLKQTNQKTGLLFALILTLLFLPSLSALAIVYQPGQTLDPACAPTDVNCGVAAVITGGGSIIPDTDSLYDLGSSAKQWRELHLSGGTFYLGGFSLTASSSTGALIWGGPSIETTPSATLTGQFKFRELIGNGSNFVGFKAPDSISANIMWILPSADGASGQVLSTNGSGALSWVSGAGAGVTSINGISASAQTFTTGSSGSNFGIVSSGSVHTFNLPTASATVRGLLSSTSWTAFNSKEPAIVASTSATYFRGDKTFRILDTSVIPENGNLYYTDARARNALSVAVPLTYNSSTGAFGITKASSSASGYLSSTDWSTFNNKLSSAITSLNGLSGSSQTFAVGTGGADFNISSSGTAHTFNIPDASATARGLVSTGAQTFAGVKTFSNGVSVSGDFAINTASIGGNITIGGTLNTHTIPGGTGTLALTSDLHPALAFTGQSYLSLDAGSQVLTANKVSLTNHVTGALNIASTSLNVSAAGLTYFAPNITLTTGFNIPLTASTSNWETFRDTPSNRITNGSFLNWSGNTLNVSGLLPLSGGTLTGNLIGTGASLSSNFEVGGTASISGATTLRGITYTWPAADGSANQRLTTNGSGALSWTTVSGGSGITRLAGVTDSAINLLTGTAGTNFNIATSSQTITFNIPDASATARGLVSTGAQTFAGNKLLSGLTVIGDVGVETNNALLAVKSTTRNTLAGVGNKNNYFLEVAHHGDTIGNGAGLAFRVSVDSDNVGAAIIHERVGINSQGKLHFYTKQSTGIGAAPVVALTIDQAGKIGIGTTSPTTKLDISGSASVSSNFEVGGTASISGATTLRGITYTWPAADGSANQRLTTNGSGALSWTTVSGGSGITRLAGVTDSAINLLTGTAGTNFNIATSSQTITFNIPDASAATRGLVTTGAQTIAGNKLLSGLTVIGESGTETSNALFGVKTTTRNALAGVGDKNNYLLELAYDANTNGNGVGLVFRSSTDSSNVGAAIIHERTSSNSQGKLHFYTKQSATVGVAPVAALTINETGNTGIGALAAATSSTLCYNTTAITGMNTFSTCSSDERLKDNIATINEGLTAIMGLRPVNYVAKDDESDRVRAGFIAQESIQFVGESAALQPNGFYDWDSNAVLAYAVKAIQEVASLGDTFRQTLIAWFADAANSIGDFFAKKIHTEQICLKKSNGGEYCVSGDDLESVMNQKSATLNLPVQEDQGPEFIEEQPTTDNPIEPQVEQVEQADETQQEEQTGQEEESVLAESVENVIQDESVEQGADQQTEQPIETDTKEQSAISSADGETAVPAQGDPASADSQPSAEEIIESGATEEPAVETPEPVTEATEQVID